MSYKQISELRKKLAEREIQLRRLKSYKKHLFKVLEHLTEQYYNGQLTYKEYSKAWTEALGELSLKEWIERYNAKATELNQEISQLRKEIAFVREKLEKERTAKIVSLTLITILLSIAMTSWIAEFGGIGAITGAVVYNETAPIQAAAQIQVYLSVAKSSNLSAGITFGNLTIGVQDNNATANYLGAGGTSEYYLVISSDSNVNVDQCIGASGDLITSDGSVLKVGNLTWSSDTSGTPPGPAGSTPMSTTNTTSQTNIPPGGTIYYRFWLDIPGDQPPGAYTNTIYFITVQSGTGC